MGSGPDRAAEMENDDQTQQDDREDDPEDEHPPWSAVVPPVGARLARLGMRGVGHQAPRSTGQQPSLPRYRDMLSVSSQVVSPTVVTYTSIVPKLWTDTIQAHRREVRLAVLDVTAALVAEHGLRSVTMSQIAEKTGIGRATLYKYFPDVEAILLAWHERQITGHLADQALRRP